MTTIESLLNWTQSIGVGGAFFIVALFSFVICGIALYVVLAALKRDK